MRRPIGVLVAALVVAACSSDGGDSAEPPPTTAPEAAAPAVRDLFGTERSLAIAHAGGERDYPKETLFAFGQAVADGVDVLELDVHLSADGEIVVIHDDTVDRTTNAQGAVADLTAAELGALDAAHWFATGCGTCHDEPDADYPYRGVRDGDQPPPEGYAPGDFGVPTLAEVATRFPGMPLDIEIKPEGDTGVAVAEALAAELRALGREESSIVVSFDQAVVDAFREEAPEVAVSPGTEGATAWFLGQAPLEGYAVLQVPPTYEGVEVVTADTVARAHAEGLDVWVWMTDADQETAEFYAEMFALGVDGIIGDHPKVLVDVAGSQ